MCSNLEACLFLSAEYLMRCRMIGCLDMGFREERARNIASSWMWHRVAWYMYTSVVEERAVPVFSVQEMMEKASFSRTLVPVFKPRSLTSEKKAVFMSTPSSVEIWRAWKVPVSTDAVRVEIWTRTFQAINTNYVLLLAIVGSWRPWQDNVLSGELRTWKQLQSSFNFNNSRCLRHRLTAPLTINWLLQRSFKLVILAEPP